MESDAPPQPEGVGFGVGRHVPRLGERRHEMPRGGLPDERLAHVQGDADRGVEIGDLRIHRIVQVEPEPVDQRAAARRRRGGPQHPARGETRRPDPGAGRGDHLPAGHSAHRVDPPYPRMAV